MTTEYRALGMHAIIIVVLVAASAAAQKPEDAQGGTAGAPLKNEPLAKIFIDPPLALTLPGGAAIIPYRTENLRIAPLFGAAALSLSPRV